jgi:hypothetical protein
MSKEIEVATIMAADTELSILLPGGIYQASLLGEDGISRGDTPEAFDENGWLQPCALVRERGIVPSGDLVDYESQTIGTVQVVEIWLYEDSGFVNINASIARLLVIFLGKRLSDSWELYPANIINGERDQGALKGRSLARVDLAVHATLTAAEL